MLNAVARPEQSGPRKKQKIGQGWRHRANWKKVVTFDDCFISHYGLEWRLFAAASQTWKTGENTFVYDTLDRAKLAGTQLRTDAEKKMREAAEAAGKMGKRKRVVFEEPVVWRQTPSPCPLGPKLIADIRGDSELIINWLNAKTR